MEVRCGGDSRRRHACARHSAARAETRIALVIGNGAYQAVPTLANPPNDARDVADALKSVGFAVTLGVDLDQAKMQAAIADFARSRGDRRCLALLLRRARPSGLRAQLPHSRRRPVAYARRHRETYDPPRRRDGPADQRLMASISSSRRLPQQSDQEFQRRASSPPDSRASATPPGFSSPSPPSPTMSPSTATAATAPSPNRCSGISPRPGSTFRA